MSDNWPLEATPEDCLSLPPPWDGDIDVTDPMTESALLALLHHEPSLVLKVCRSAFCQAEARGNRQAALHALYLACVTLDTSFERLLADRVLAVVRERAQGLGPSRLSVRIASSHATQLS